MNSVRSHSSAIVLLVLPLLGAGYLLQSGLQAQEQPPAASKPSAEDAQSDKKVMCPMMAGLKGIDFYSDSPALLLARGEQLQLTEDQQQKLTELSERTRQQARELLTQEQRAELEKGPQGPLSAMQLAKMGGKDPAAEQDSPSMCPMCMKMMKSKNPEQR